MPSITFSALSFLRKPLQSQGIGCCESPMEIADGTTPAALIERLGLSVGAVEAVFINGKAGGFEDVLRDGDRVALLPPGTPGPHRVLLRIRKP